jgi:cyclase
MYRWIWVLLVLLSAGVAGAQQEQDWDAIEVKAIPVAGNVYMLTGSGGNMGLSVGDDGTILVDDQFAPLTDKIVAAIQAITPDPVRFIINTHFHPDHTGGNENFGKTGSLITAHENVRLRMSTEQVRTVARQDTTPAAPPIALPKITFSDEVTFHWNGDTIHVFHVDNAHTDGDSIVHFVDADVVHMGDTFFRGRYPFIDVDFGGNINGLISAADWVLSLVTPDTKIIPGHGELGTPADLRRYRNMLSDIRDQVQILIDQGRTIDEVVAAKPAAEYDTDLGENDAFVQSVYYSLTM